MMNRQTIIPIVMAAFLFLYEKVAKINVSGLSRKVEKEHPRTVILSS